MSTNRRKTDFDAVHPPLSIKELTAVLVKHYGLTEGKYDLGIEFQIGTGGVGPNPEELLPGVILGIKSVGLAPAKGNAKNSIDASEVASTPPEKKPRAKKAVPA